ncbi:MAG: ribbon-helix-helix domain-containing protein [Thermomicrobiales bacterium]
MATRTHIVLPLEMIEEIDRIAGKRRRSEFIEDAIRAKLVNARQREALRASAGILNPDDYPEWSTPEKTSEWVRRQREPGDEWIEHVLERSREQPE